MNHKDYMLRAIELAKKGNGWTTPNPLVGAVIVKNNRIIGEGYHERYGEKHAERNAFANLKESAEGAVMYVTLEPCCHYGKQPPCTEAIIEHGIKTVYIGSEDPNPLVSGKGVAILREHGIHVIQHYMKEECDRLNDVFFHYIKTKRPYVVMKYAMTLDGKIATRTGASKWITGEEARAHVQEMRGKYASILVGIGTVLSDDPMLNCRIEGAHQPLRIVLDSKLRIPLESQLIQTAKDYRTLVACAVEEEDQAYAEKIQKLQECKVQVAYVPDDNNKVSVEKLMTLLGEMQIDSIFVEGGGEVHDAFRKAGVVKKILCYIAPKIFGGKEAKTPVSGQGIAEVAEALLIDEMKVKRLGQDLLIEAMIKEHT